MTKPFTVPGCGGLAGRNFGTISDCSVEGFQADNITVLSGYKQGRWTGVGGLVGFNQGGKIYNCYTKDVSITGKIENAGGLIGDTGENTGKTSIIKNCCVYGTVHIEANGVGDGGTSANGAKAGAVAGHYDNGAAGEAVSDISDIYYTDSAVLNGTIQTMPGIQKTEQAFISGEVMTLLNEGKGSYHTWYQGIEGPVLRESEQWTPPVNTPELLEAQCRQSASYQYGEEMVFDQGFVASYTGDIEKKQMGMQLERDGKKSELIFDNTVSVEGGSDILFGFVIERIPEQWKGKIAAEPFVK